MSTRATVYIHGQEDEMDIKLYHHRDGYVEYLGCELEKALEKWRKGVNRMLKGKGWNNPTLIQCVANIGGFEQARPLHGDVEYVYHINYGIEDRKAWYDITCQSGPERGEENVLKSKRVLLAWNGGSGRRRKKINWKKAEKELGNEDKYIKGHLDE